MRALSTLIFSCCLLGAAAYGEEYMTGARAAGQPAPAPAAKAGVKPTSPAAAPVAAHPAGGEPAAQGLDAKRSLERLMQGNLRFVADLTSKVHRDGERRVEIAKGQHPIAIVVCCSDSRVPPEQVFDVGLGDIFVIRVAGNVLDAIGLGSIEYAAAHLQVPLVVILGHERCGAVTAAISGDTAPGHVLAITDMIQRHLAGSRPVAGDTLDQAICLNAQKVAEQVATSAPILKELVATGKLGVVAMRYDLDDGVVKVLP